ncbi:conserved protein, unknown function [Hepatocystis sp. ex Piliocolobus tephrosceles]|nr:conserved protein, unknown function [Hepatocystis sp. ex Piliocolobus tephrosceles]
MLKNYFRNLFKLPQHCVKLNYESKRKIITIKRFVFNSNIIYMNNWKHNYVNTLYLSCLNNKFGLTFKNSISTKRRRYYKIRKHQKKKYKKKRMGLSTIPWIPIKEKIRTYKLPKQSRLINKRFMRDKKGGRRYRLKKQR